MNYLASKKIAFREYSLSHEGLLLDYSKNFIKSETVSLLLDLAQQSQLPSAIDAMFRGEEINTTEQRAALHVALRAPRERTKTPEVNASLERMESLVAELHGGKWTGYSGKGNYRHRPSWYWGLRSWPRDGL